MDTLRIKQNYYVMGENIDFNGRYDIAVVVIGTPDASTLEEVRLFTELFGTINFIITKVVNDQQNTFHIYPRTTIKELNVSGSRNSLEECLQVIKDLPPSKTPRGLPLFVVSSNELRGLI